MSAVLAFIGGFWVLPDAPFFLPEGLDRTGLQLIFMNGWENIRVCDYADLSLVLVLFLVLSGWGGLRALAPAIDDGQMKKSLLSMSGLSFVASLLGTMPLTAAPESAAGPATDAGYRGGARRRLRRLCQPRHLSGRARQPPAARADSPVPLVFLLWFLVHLVTGISCSRVNLKKECFDSCQCIGIRMENIC